MDDLMNKPLNFFTTEDVQNLTLKWIETYAKWHNFKVNDVVECFQSQLYKKENSLFDIKYEIEYLPNISISYLQRTLVCGFPKASSIMEDLENKHIVEHENGKYAIVDRTKLKGYITLIKK
ncbi:MAG: DNA translocase FtsK [Bacilli bacterium]|nr:DNA translocase FtsK [Bacilli bacterium]